MKEKFRTRWKVILPAAFFLVAAAVLICRFAGVGSSVRAERLEGFELSVSDTGELPDRITVKMSNGTGGAIGYGDFFVIQVYKPLWGWVDAPEAELDAPLTWNDVDRSLDAGSEMERDYGLWIYEELDSGKYRILIPVWTDDPAEKIFAAAEFTV